MIRRLRPHVGSDSSIEERVRRRRRKRKTKLLAEREKSAPARFHLKDVSSSDEAANSKEQTDARNSREKVEKIVQTEFSLKPSSLQSQFEGMLLETINDGETATDELRQNRQSRETMPPTRDHISSGDSDKNTSIQIVEALVHKERVSLESEEQDRLSEKEERDDEELANQIDGGLNGDTSLTQSKFNEVGSFDDGTPQPTEIAGDQGSAISTSKNESGKTGESGKTLGQQQAQTSENETNAAGLPEPVGEVKKEEPLLINEHAGHPVMVDGDKSATRPEPCTVNDDSSERPDRFEAHHNEMLHVDGIKSSGTLSATSAQETTINEEAGLGGTVQTVGNEVPNDDLVAEVLLKSFQEDNDGVSPHPSGQADESHDEKENKDSLHSRPTIGGISADEDILVAKGSLDQEEGNETQSSTKESISVKDEFADTTGMKDGVVKDVDYSSEKIQSAEQESETNIHFAQEADGEEERVLKTDPAVKKSIDKDEEDAYKYSRDSLDMEGSLDELAMNITKDSDDAPIEPTIGLPEPVENVELVKPWDRAVESQADRVAVDVINASADRALIKVLGDPTGGLSDSAVTADKRKHLRRKREGNKRWMNTRSTESFEVLKLPDDRTDEDVLFEDDKTSGTRDGSQSPATKGGKVKRSTSRGKVRMQRPCKRNKDTDLDPAALSTVSVTQAVQYSIRKAQLVRKEATSVLPLSEWLLASVPSPLPDNLPQRITCA
ncbi:unnamed protein product [Nesidiocoris tenuis]|uniref:Uncharacterized protein n=1 Tax=Nesidiocoris tenuis TaxID=355587 RepID=A0A6H5GHM1_9HEMI|nr:unnamed protein product [Nesidiocoris tenuis]